MGASPHLALPDPAQLHRPSLPSPAGSVFSSDSCATSASLSSSDSSSSSLTSHESLPPGDGDPSIKQEEKSQQQQQQCKQSAVLEVNLGHESPSRLKPNTGKSLSVKGLRERSCATRTSLRRACCNCLGAFAADCAAVTCCPCGVLSLFSFFLIEIPTVLARKAVTHLQTRLCIKDATSASRSGESYSSRSIITPTESCREASDGEGEKQEVGIIRFSTQNLLEHFNAEHVGFGCLSQKRQ